MIVACAGGGVHAYELATGDALWSQQGSKLAQAPVIVGGGLLLVEPDAVRLLDAESGHQLRDIRIGSSVSIKQAVVTEDEVILLTAEGELVRVS